jgi:hypothetical protein
LNARARNGYFSTADNSYCFRHSRWGEARMSIAPFKTMGFLEWNGSGPT